MHIILERKYPKEGYTIGSLVAYPHPLPKGKGELFRCDTLEPPVGTEKEMRTAGSKKAIPPGTYLVKLKWSQRFQEYLPRLEDIPPKQGGLGGLGARSGILIHAGNSPRDSTGCILVGKNTQVGRVTDSRRTLENLISIIRQAQNNGEAVTININ